MDGITFHGLHVDPHTGVTSNVYFTDTCGTIRLLETGGVWTATDEDGYTLPGLFATADEALDNAEAYTHIQAE